MRPILTIVQELGFGVPRQQFVTSSRTIGENVPPKADRSRRHGIAIMDSHVTVFGRVGSFRP